jgi:hypothetical protein
MQSLRALTSMYAVSNNFKVALASKPLVFLYSFSEKSFTVFSPEDSKNYYDNHQEH